MYLLFVIPVWLCLCFVVATGARNRGRSYGSFFIISFLLSPLIGLFILATLGPVKQEEVVKSYNTNHKEEENKKRKCPYCAEIIQSEAIICRYCNKDIKQYDEELNKKEYEIEQQKKRELSDKYKNISDIINDETIMEEGKEIRRIYGKSAYIGFIQKKATELGLGEISLSEDDIE